MNKGKIELVEYCPLCGGKSAKTIYSTEAGVIILSEYICPNCGTFVRMNFLVSDKK